MSKDVLMRVGSGAVSRGSGSSLESCSAVRPKPMTLAGDGTYLRTRSLVDLGLGLRRLRDGQIQIQPSATQWGLQDQLALVGNDLDLERLDPSCKGVAVLNLGCQNPMRMVTMVHSGVHLVRTLAAAGESATSLGLCWGACSCWVVVRLQCGWPQEQWYTGLPGAGRQHSLRAARRACPRPGWSDQNSVKIQFDLRGWQLWQWPSRRSVAWRSGGH